MEFPRVLKKYHVWNSRGQLKKKCYFPGWSKDVKQFYRIAKSKDLFCPEFPKVKVKSYFVWSRKNNVDFDFWP